MHFILRILLYISIFSFYLQHSNASNMTLYNEKNDFLNKDKGKDKELCTYYGGTFDCNTLTNCNGAVTIDSSITIVNDFAFSECLTLTSITIPTNSSLTIIGPSAFFGCLNLTSINIPINSSLTSIRHNAFQYCSKLKNITIPKSVISIGDFAFSNCTALSTFVIQDCKKFGLSATDNVILPDDYPISQIFSDENLKIICADEISIA